jgi:pimeloyl-ACP methyl ester carboxylesterase
MSIKSDIPVKSDTPEKSDMGPAKTGNAQVNGTTLYYEEKGSGTPVVLLHAMTMDSHMWDAYFDVLAQNHRTIRYDLRGHGKSSGIAEKECTATAPCSHAKDLAALLDCLKVDKASFVGFCYGGGEVLSFAVNYPTRVTSIVVMGPTLEGNNWELAPGSFYVRVAGYAAKAQFESVKAGLEAFGQDFLFSYAMKVPYAANLLGQMMAGHIALGQKAFFATFLDFTNPQAPQWNWADATDPNKVAALHLSEITVPTLAILGGLDIKDYKDIYIKVVSEIPNAKGIIIPGSGHIVALEKADEVSKATVDFLKSF